MQKIIGFFFMAFLVVAGSSSCKKEKDPDIDMGYNYFPDQVGKYVVYDVDSFYYYNTPTIVDTFKFQLKELVADTLKDARGRASFKIERYIRANSTEPWLPDVKISRRNARSAQLALEDMLVVKNSGDHRIMADIRYAEHRDRENSSRGIAQKSRHYHTLITPRVWNQEHVDS